jgi:PiT family inorganic phosphate transporter
MAAVFLAWTDGSNNAADAIGTAVGARVIDLRRALIIAAISDFAGALLFGPFVSETMMHGIVRTSGLSDTRAIISGMIAALLATAIMEFLSSLLKIPMPVTVGIVTSVATFGFIAGGASSVKWGSLALIFISWVVLPAFSAVIAFLLFKVYRRMFEDNRRLPIVAGSSAFILIFSTAFLLLFKTGAYSNVSAVLLNSIILGLAVAAGLWLFTRKAVHGFEGRDKVAKALMVMAMASLAFSHGANDVGKAAGPLTSIYVSLCEGSIPSSLHVSPIALIISAAGIALGIWSWGHRVVGTIGEDITTLSCSSAFTAQIASALSVLIMTRLGMPVSTTQAVVGSVAGVGLATGIRTVNFRTLGKILSTWLVAIPVSAGITALLYYLLMM